MENLVFALRLLITLERLHEEDPMKNVCKNVSIAKRNFQNHSAFGAAWHMKDFAIATLLQNVTDYFIAKC